jgi:uncharacterized membrane protein
MADLPLIFNSLGMYLLAVLFPIIAFYMGYLIVTRSFDNMGFSEIEAIVIVFVSYLFGSGILDNYSGISFADIPLFTYHVFWVVGISLGGAIIPVVLSVYLSMKHKIRPWWILLGVACVALVTFFVTSPDPDKGIVAKFPLWIFPVFTASIISVLLYWKEKKKAAPLAYIIGTLGVLIGADVLHLISLLNFEIHSTRNAVIGGANVFDMIFITGLLAVFVDSLFMYQGKRKKKET